MTVVTNRGVKLDGDWNCGFSLNNLRKSISFGTFSPITLNSLSIHRWRPGELLENNIKQLDYYIYHVYIFFGTGIKANVQIQSVQPYKTVLKFQMFVGDMKNVC